MPSACNSAWRKPAGRQENAGEPAVLLVPPQLRQNLTRFLRSSLPNLHVLAWNEIPDNRKVRLVTAVGNNGMSKMKIIRHTARDMRQALRAVREQLGEDAVILSSRTHRRRCRGHRRR